MDDYRQKIFELVSGAQDGERLELVLRFAEKVLECGGNCDTEGTAQWYRKSIMRTLFEIDDTKVLRRIYLSTLIAKNKPWSIAISQQKGDKSGKRRDKENRDGLHK